VRMDCLGRGSKVMTPSGPVLLPPLVSDGDSLPVACLPVDDSLAESGDGAESVSEGESGESGESYP
jgi:hypothetical protein